MINLLVIKELVIALRPNPKQTMCKLLKNNIIVLFCLTYLSFSADAQTFSFAPIIGTCPGSSLTTTATIKGVKVNTIYADNGSPTDPEVIALFLMN